MIVSNGTAKNIKVAYIGGGSRGWAWGLMSDLALEKALSGEVVLYDIDKVAEATNVVIGNKIKEYHKGCDNWTYTSAVTLDEALKGVDFVVISILPGTFEEMESDVHAPEGYGIYQPVGDSTGLGGIIRSLRTIPMMEEIALAVKRNCPNAYVINYTNPMTVCVKTLYSAYPNIKVAGCCHEVAGTRWLMGQFVKERTGEKVSDLDIYTEVAGVNHFTWITKAYYRNEDIYPLYAEYAQKYASIGYRGGKDENWFNSHFNCTHKVKFDLFNKFGIIAAAGDRHLSEFCPREWYLSSPQAIKDWGFHLTTVRWRKEEYQERLARAERLKSGQEIFRLEPTGEPGVRIIKAACGIEDFISNINVINEGQMPQAPLGAVVETNAVISSLGIKPIMTSPLPDDVYAMVDRIIRLQELTVQAGIQRDAELAFKTFCLDPQNSLNETQSRSLYDTMLKNTLKYLPQEYTRYLAAR